MHDIVYGRKQAMRDAFPLVRGMYAEEEEVVGCKPDVRTEQRFGESSVEIIQELYQVRG